MPYALYHRGGKASRYFRRGVGAPARSKNGPRGRRPEEALGPIATHESAPESTSATANRRLAVKLLGVIVIAFAFGFSLVPLYDSICRLTGINGRTAKGPVAANFTSQVDRERLVTVEFTSTVMPGLPWEIRPLATHLDLHPGEIQQARFLVHNRSNQPVVGQAVPSVSPGQAATHFNKLDCFCFRQQTLAPGETKELPLTFIVDPGLDRDVRTITLAYAFFKATKAPGALGAPGP